MTTPNSTTTASPVLLTGTPDVNGNVVLGSPALAIGGGSSGTIGTTGLTGQLVSDIDSWKGAVVEMAARRADNTTAAQGAQLYWGRQRGTLAVPAIVQSGDSLFDHYGFGYDGATYQQSVAMHAYCEGTPAAGIIPGVLTLATANAAGVLTNGLKLNSNQTLSAPGNFATTYRTVTASTDTAGNTDNTITANFAGIVTETLPDATKFTGRIIRLRTITNNTVVSATSNVVPLAGGSAGTAILSGTAGKWADLQSDGTAWQITASN